MRSKTFGYTVLKKMHEAAERLSKEHDPARIQKLKALLDGFYAAWEKTSERRKVKRQDNADSN